MFDEYLRTRSAQRPGNRSSLSTPTPTTDTYVDGKPREDGVRSFLGSRGIDLPSRRRPQPRPSRPRQPQERPVPAASARPTASRCSRGPGVICRPSRRGPAARGGVVERQHPRGARADRAWTPTSSSGWTASRFVTEHIAGQARAGLVPARREPARRRTPATAAVFEDALSGVTRAGPDTSAWWSASTGSGSQMRCGTTAPTSSSPTWRSCCEPSMITDDAFPVEPWHIRETQLRPRLAGRSPSRCSRCPTATSACAATSTRASRYGLPGHLPRTRSTRSGRCRTPRRGTAIPRTDRRSSTSPTARSSGCWSTTSRSTSGTANCSRTNGFSTFAQARSSRTGAVALTGGQAGQGAPRRGWCRWRNAASPRSSTSSRPSTNSLRVTVQSELVANEDQPEPSDDPRVAAVLDEAAGTGAARVTPIAARC